MQLRGRRTAAVALLLALALAAAPAADAAADVRPERAERRERREKPARKGARDAPSPEASRDKKEAEAAAQDAHDFGKIAVPRVKGLDQSPTLPPYGRCTDALDPHIRPASNWCQFGRMGSWPTGPIRKAKKLLKFGRMTVYRGPVYGSEPNHWGACNANLAGTNETAIVAVSTKYLKTAQGGWVDDKGACGACMCVHLHGVDNLYNTGVRDAAAKKHFGLTFLGKVGDRCGECEDDHIDVLMDRPFAYAPYDPANPRENANALFANAQPGPRGFSDPGSMRPGDLSPETVGTWTADWQFVPCSGWSHDRCALLMTAMGYTDVSVPQETRGVDSRTLKAPTEKFPVPWAEARRAAAAARGGGAPQAS